MRVATGALSHETSTFTPVLTTRESYDARQSFLRGDEILTYFRGANTPIGGFIEGADTHGFELIATIFAEPHPSGPTPRALFEEILDELLDGIAAAGAIDGILLELHGAMVAEGIDDGEGHILEAVRRLVGPAVPIVAQLDIHSNISYRMVAIADALIGRETYPEVDMAARGRECADVLQRILCEGLRPEMALCQLPMVWGMNQVTAHPPMRQAIEYLHQIEARPGIVCASIATCFPLADIPDMGASVYVVADSDRALAQACADEVGAWIYERRTDWQLAMPNTEDLLPAAAAAGSYPVIFADRNDNTGGGSPGDSTGMLRAFLEADLEDACVLYIVDPEVIAICHAAGVGAILDLDVGGKSSPLQGAPCRMRAEVVALSDGGFKYDGPMYGGLEASMGPSAHIKESGVHVLLVTEREQPFDTAFSRTLGLDPQKMRYIGVKSAAHFRAGFEEWAGVVHVVGEPGVHDMATAGLTFCHLHRNVYPFDNI